jgi:glycine dehydrogenase subunit 1
MSSYLPNTEADRKKMLDALGVSSVEALFEDIPKEVRQKAVGGLPGPLSEDELVRHLTDLSERNCHLGQCVSFLGAGIYDHFIPSVVDAVASRGEFYTAYTPYQPEISQGTLTAIFEYQSMICELTGMHVSNASMYDGASALAEAAFMACGATKRDKVLVAKTVHPEYREVTRTYTRFRGVSVEEIGHNQGVLDLDDLASKLDDSVAAVLVQSPNFLGGIEDVKQLAEMAHQKGAMLVVSVDPISLSLFEPPGKLGADIVTGEGQALGNPTSFGGPHFGFMAATKKLLRKMPGRIVGQTQDLEGRRGFVLTLQAREQHIRREKATSNICTNQALCALMGAVYMATMGKEGLKEVARLCYDKAHYAMEKLLEHGFSRVLNGPFFKEFVVSAPEPVESINARLLKEGFVGGYDLSKDYPEIEKGWLVAVTERRSREEIDRFSKVAGGEKK